MTLFSDRYQRFYCILIGMTQVLQHYACGKFKVSLSLLVRSYSCMVRVIRNAFWLFSLGKNQIRYRSETLDDGWNLMMGDARVFI